MAENTELIQINKGIKRLVKLIETSTIVDKTAVNEMRKARQFAERERDEKGRFVKKEEEIQDDKASLAEKNVEFLSTSKKSWKQRKDEEWKLLKENHKIFKVARAFWQSEAGQAIKNVFSRIKSVFDNIMGEIGEFFSQLWGTIKDTFNFVTGTFTSIMDALRGGNKKERREKDQAKDIKDIKENLTRRQRRNILRKGKKAKGESGLFSQLGIRALFGAGTIAAMLPLILPALGIGAIVASLGVAIYKGYNSFLDSNTAGQVVADALKGLFTITRITGSWLGKLIDLIFGTNIQDWFKKQKWDSFFDEHFPPVIDAVFYTIKDLIIEMIEFTKSILSGELKKRIAGGIKEWLDDILPEFMGGKGKSAEEKAEEKKLRLEAIRKQSEAISQGLAAPAQNEWKQAHRAEKKKREAERKKAEDQDKKKVKALEDIKKATERFADTPAQTPGVVMPRPRSSAPTPAPNLNSQKAGQNNNN